MVEAGIRQRVLITAGAVGIGRAIAEAFVDQGAEVWVVDVDEASLANKNAPSRLTETHRRQSVRLISSTGAMGPAMPAFAHSTSRPPHVRSSS